MQGVRGKTNNPNGRPKGTPNKVTGDLKKWITNFIEGKTSQIEKDWERLQPKDRLMLFEKLLKYVIPMKADVGIRTHKLGADYEDAIKNGKSLFYEGEGEEEYV